jgi:hypothetical protein
MEPEPHRPNACPRVELDTDAFLQLAEQALKLFSGGSSRPAA